ncbi:hypothetical protein B0H10DRAFT_2065660 [Mycena sp. CBHHK59/15]|nr:hypothetical protein B0H10DRAFT_2065660 [Mycena sp. CBHHK59/15]
MQTNPVILHILGAWDLSVFADLILQGALFAQIAHYVTLYERDARALRVFVGVLFVLTTLKSVQAIAISWIQNVERFGNLVADEDLFHRTWPAQVNITFEGIIAFYVQLFFCQRLWAISRNIYVVGVVMILFIFQLVAAIISTVLAFSFNKDALTSHWVSIHLGTVFAGDALLCGSTMFFLLRRSKSALPPTASLLHAILKLTLQSAAPAAFFAFLNLLGTSAGGTTQVNSWHSLAIITNMALPKVYATSAMWTLNSRREIRAISSTRHTNSGSEPGLSGGRRRVNNVGPSTLPSPRSPIQVRKQVETVEASDPEYSPSKLTHEDEGKDEWQEGRV